MIQVVLSILYSRSVLWLLFGVNAVGTVYGYYWYKNQLAHTYTTMDRWLLPFVPDSPTASLFFTLSLLMILVDQAGTLRGTSTQTNKLWSAVRSFIDTFALITSIKYGIWAVAMIIAGALQGDVIVWKEWMLIVSHTGMAVQVLIYASWMKLGRITVLIVAVWTFFNDYLDYHRGIYPWLPNELDDDLDMIERFTIGLSTLSILVAYGLYLVFHKQQRI